MDFKKDDFIKTKLEKMKNFFLKNKALSVTFTVLLIIIAGLSLNLSMTNATQETLKTDYEQKIGELQSTVDTLTDDKKNLENENSEYKNKISNFSDSSEELENYKTQCSELETKYNKLQTDYNTLKTNYDKLSAEKTAISTASTSSASSSKASSTSNSTKVSSTTNTTNTSASNDDSKKNSHTVYITNTGSKYHSGGCRYLKKSKIAISESDAISQGYSACSVCNP